MGLFGTLCGTLWVILIVLKIVGVIHAGWLTVILWPAILFVILFLVMAVLGVSAAGFASFRKR